MELLHQQLWIYMYMVGHGLIRCLLSLCFKSYVCLQQDKVTEKSLQELKILPKSLETLQAQRFSSDTQEKIGPQAQRRGSPIDLSSCCYSEGCLKLGVLSQSLPVCAKCELSPTSRLAREEAPSHAAVLFSECSHSLTPHTSSCQRMRQGQTSTHLVCGMLLSGLFGLNR